MKKHLFIFLLVSLFIACKKEKKQQPLFDITGTWVDILETDSAVDHSISQFISASKYPCLSSNILILRADGTGVSKYIGKDICYVTTNESIGTPGQDSTLSTWTRNGNNIHFIFKYGNSTKNSNALVSMVNNKLQLFFRDTLALPSPNPLHIQTSTEIKQ
jgi:hypothetical protein